MRSFLTIALLCSVLTGCRTQQPDSDAVSPPAPLTSSEALSLASVYVVIAGGACGTAATTIEDAGAFWKVQTVHGLGGHPGPELHIDKLTRKISVVWIH